MNVDNKAVNVLIGSLLKYIYLVPLLQRLIVFQIVMETRILLVCFQFYFTIQKFSEKYLNSCEG